MSEYSDILLIEDSLKLVKEYGPEDLTMFLEVVKIDFEDLSSRKISGTAYREQRQIGLDNSLKDLGIYLIATVIVHELTHIKYHMDQYKFSDDYIYCSLLAHPFIQKNKDAVHLIKEEKLIRKLTHSLGIAKENEHSNSIQEEVDAKINQIKFWKKIKSIFNLEDSNMDYWLYFYESQGFNGIKRQIAADKEYSHLPEYSDINSNKAIINSVRELIYNIKNYKNKRNFFIKNDN